MAIVKDGIMGPFQNKVGTVVGRKFRGLDVMTGLYKKKSVKPPSEEQLRQQSRFGMLSTLLSDSSELITPGFQKFVKRGQSPVNTAFEYNFSRAFVENVDDTQFNFPKIVFSRGPVERPNCASVSLVSADLMRFSWLPQAENVNNRYNDKASFLLYEVEKKKVIVLRNKAQRGDLQYEFELPESLKGKTFYCFMCFSNANGKLVGDSVYIGLGLPLF